MPKFFVWEDGEDRETAEPMDAHHARGAALSFAMQHLPDHVSMRGVTLQVSAYGSRNVERVRVKATLSYESVMEGECDWWNADRSAS